MLLLLSLTLWFAIGFATACSKSTTHASTSLWHACTLLSSTYLCALKLHHIFGKDCEKADATSYDRLLVKGISEQPEKPQIVLLLAQLWNKHVLKTRSVVMSPAPPCIFTIHDALCTNEPGAPCAVLHAPSSARRQLGHRPGLHAIVSLEAKHSMAKYHPSD